MILTKRYPSSYLWTNVAELLHELNIDAEVKDVRTFGYLPDEGPRGAISIEVFTHNKEGAKTGTVTHTRWVETDVKFEDWGNPPE